MLERGVLSLQKCKKALWEFAPSDSKTVLILLIHPREKMWKSLFMKEKDEQGNIRPFPVEGSDRGLTAVAGGEQVSNMPEKSF
jgi:hypothetical protein